MTKLSPKQGVVVQEKELAYARAHGFSGLNIVTGGPFNGSLVNALLGA